MLEKICVGFNRENIMFKELNFLVCWLSSSCLFDVCHRLAWEKVFYMFTYGRSREKCRGWSHGDEAWMEDHEFLASDVQIHRDGKWDWLWKRLNGPRFYSIYSIRTASFHHQSRNNSSSFLMPSWQKPMSIVISGLAISFPETCYAVSSSQEKRQTLAFRSKSISLGLLITSPLLRKYCAFSHYYTFEFVLINISEALKIIGKGKEVDPATSTKAGKRGILLGAC